jgi:hypothetical protein
MALTPIEFNEICCLVCPHCRANNIPRQRTDTLEWVHDLKKNATISHAVCWATGLRNSHFVKDIAEAS